jgi:hypothetical protein
MLMPVFGKTCFLPLIDYMLQMISHRTKGQKTGDYMLQMISHRTKGQKTALRQ